jgi:hypothetical protein
MKMRFMEDMMLDSAWNRGGKEKVGIKDWIILR